MALWLWAEIREAQRVWTCVRQVGGDSPEGMSQQDHSGRKHAKGAAKRRATIRPKDTHRFVEELVGDDLHAKRVHSLGDAVVGVMHAASLSIHAIGVGLAATEGLKPKHAIKQVDRLLSNAQLDVWDLFDPWVRYAVGPRESIVVAIDWTEFEPDGQSTVVVSLVTRHGRATPLVWKSAFKSDITDGERNDLEDEVLLRLQQALPEGVAVTLLADRGFGDVELYEALTERFGWDFVIRFRGCITVTDAKGRSHPASDWVAPSGRARMMRDVQVTQQDHPLAAVVLVHAKNMNEPWCLATTRTDIGAAQVVKLYGRRFTIEETFRDGKDLRFGMGLYATHIGDPRRRDRLLFVSALAQALLTMLGAASEATGFDRYLKVNTSKKRTHSLLRQGQYWYSAIPTMPEHELRTLMEAFERIVSDQQLVRETFGLI